jgi:siroheme synthase
MGLRAARFVQGRLMLHGASPKTPVTIIENASRPEENRVSATLGELCEHIIEAGIAGPAIIFIGLQARRSRSAQSGTRRQAV